MRYINKIKKVIFLSILLSVSVLASQTIELGNTIDGTWSDSSQTKEYTFTLAEGKDILIDYIVPDTDNIVRIRLISDVWDNPGNRGGDSGGSIQSTHTQRSFTLVAGTYTINIENPHDGDQTFQLSLSEINYTYTPIELGSIIEDVWGQNENVNPTKFYTFTLAERTKVRLNVNNGGEILLRNSKKELVADPRYYIVRTLESGTYTIKLRNYWNYEGLFTLNVEQNNIVEKNIELNSKVSGSWVTESGSSTITGKRTEYYHFTLTEITEVMIKIDSAYWSDIHLLDDKGNRLQIDRDAYQFSRLGYRIFTLPPGKYIIDAGLASNVSEENLNFRLYTLTLKANNIQSVPMSLNSRLHRAFNSDTQVFEGIAYQAEDYTFTLSKKMGIAFIVDGVSPSRLSIINSEGQLIDEIYQRDQFAKVLDAGTYTIRLQKLQDSDHNGIEHFKVILKENIINNTPIALDSTIHVRMNNTSGIYYKTNQFVERYTFTLKTESYITIDISHNVNREGLYMSLFNDKKKKIASDFNYCTSHGCMKEHIATVLEAGTYTLEVYNSLDFKINTDTSIQYGWLVPINHNILF